MISAIKFSLLGMAINNSIQASTLGYANAGY